jgi:hypothetical protein
MHSGDRSRSTTGNALGHCLIQHGHSDERG